MVALSPIDERTAAIQRALERYWGFAELRPLQRPAIDAVLDGRDSLVVLPTGGGKSICFQLPAVLTGRLGIVVSPLISLMKDQVDGLLAEGIDAACLNSAQADSERREVWWRLEAGTVRLLYVAPERLVGEGSAGFRRRLAAVGPTFIAVDEAHCISQWGHDFRPDYRALGGLRDEFPGTSMHAFTATATSRVRGDIVSELGLIDPQVLVGPFDRPNLIYRARLRSSGYAQLRQLVERHPNEAGIIYCPTRKKVEAVAGKLAEWGHSAVPYHAGLPDEVRHKHQEDFSEERVNLVAATVAFGMGIDRSNVRLVAHFGAPRSVEHYQQEAGRAGRDGLEAECMLLYSASDFVGWRRLLERDGQLTPAARALLTGVERYAGAMACRHRLLVEYFGQELESDGNGCGACDWCLGELEPVEDSLVLAQKIISCVYRVRQRWGIAHVVSVLRGTENEKVLANRHHELSTFGLLADSSIAELRGYVEQLLTQGHLEQLGDRYPTLGVSESGLRLMKGEIETTLVRQERPPSRKGPSRRSKVEAESWEGVDNGLFEHLRELRQEIARELGIPPYLVFHDSMLRDMARVRPSTPEGFRTVYGVGEKKAADFGPRFLAQIEAYCRLHDLDRDAGSRSA